MLFELMIMGPLNRRPPKIPMSLPVLLWSSRPCPAKLHLPYEEFTTLAKTRLAQDTLNYK